MKRQAARNGFWKQIERGRSTMVIVDVIDVHWETVDTLRNASIPRAVVDSRIQVVHPRRVWLALALLPKYGRIEEDVSDVVQSVVLDFNRVWDTEDLFKRKVSV